MKTLFKNKKILILGITLLLILVIGITYAVVVWTTTNYGVTLDTSCFDVNYELGQDINATLNPTDTSEVIDERENTITINSDMAVSNVSLAFDNACTRYTGIATLELNVLTINNAFTENGNSYESLQYFLIPYDSTEYPTVNISTLTGETFNYIKSGTITSTGVMDIYSTSLSPNQTKEYIIVFLINSNLIDTDVIGASFTSRVDSRVEQNLSTPITDFEYEIDDREGTVKLTSYIGTSKTVVVPATYTIDGVTYNTDLVSVTTELICTGFRPQVCRDVTTIISPFKDNTNIETVYLSENLNEITLQGAFSGCTSLKNVPVIPSSITDMTETFSNCTSLINAPEIPNTVTNMSYTFSGCTSLVTAPTIPSSVTSMGSTFQNCTSLVNAPTIPSSVTYMGYTFSGCTNLTGTIRINSCDVGMKGIFDETTNSITFEVPAHSTTATNAGNLEYANVTVSEYENNVCEYIEPDPGIGGEIKK